MKGRYSLLLGLVVTMGSFSAHASAPAHPSPDESGTVYHGAQYARVDGRLLRTDVWNQARPRAASAEVRDAWRYIGGEAGWELRQHTYDFVNGRLVHSDNMPHDTPKPTYIPDRSDGPHGRVGSGG